MGVVIQIGCKYYDGGASQELDIKDQLKSVLHTDPWSCMKTYVCSDSEFKEPNAGAQADQDADAHRKALGDVIRVLDTK